MEWYFIMKHIINFATEYINIHIDHKTSSCEFRFSFAAKWVGSDIVDRWLWEHFVGRAFWIRRLWDRDSEPVSVLGSTLRLGPLNHDAGWLRGLSMSFVLCCPLFTGWQWCMWPPDSMKGGGSWDQADGVDRSQASIEPTYIFPYSLIISGLLIIPSAVQMPYHRCDILLFREQWQEKSSIHVQHRWNF